ncbi:MAG: cache domain-containing protein [Bryobacterales bacterium]|nr:cache domain-containing protein [Bryobacterales bacterium]
MAEDNPDTPIPSIIPRTQKRAKATVTSRYLLPLATAILVGVCFLLYYLVDVQQHREYLLNRNYRVLATLGEQISETLANQVAILASYIDAFEDGQFDRIGYRVVTYQRTRQKPDRLFEPEKELTELGDSYTSMASDLLHAIAPRLNNIQVRHFDPARHPAPIVPDLVRRDGEWSFQLAAIDNDGDHEASATISLQDLSQSFSPSITESFDDLLIANEAGVIVFQKQRIGPHYSYLSDLLKNASQTNAAQGSVDKSSSTKFISGGNAGDGSKQLIEANLAGTSYMIFLEPVTVDLNPAASAGKAQPQRFTLLGLVPSRHFRWQSLAISYGAIIFFSSVFLLLCLSTPIIKICFINERGRLLLREIVLLPLLFAMIAGALTSICLQTIYFNLRHDDTDDELKHISEQMQTNIKNELTAMRKQLIAACRLTPDLKKDLAFPYLVIRKNVLESEPEFRKGASYPYFANVFWTDPQGRQIVKWSPMDNATPLIDVSALESFRSIASENHYFFLDGNPFHFDSLLPPNQDGYLGVLGMRTSDCIGSGSHESGFAFISSHFLSLIDPILPLGIGFALVDDTGQVLFHSDKYRNNRENMLVETGNDRELTASLYGHSNEEAFSLDYRGNEVRARVVPVSGVLQSPWSLIVYKDSRYVQTYDLEVLTMAGVLMIGYIGFPALIACCFYFFFKPLYVPDWLWPSASASRIYRFQIEAAAVMLVLSATLIFTRPIEESLYAAAAAGYVVLIIVFWSALSDMPPSLSKRIFQGICGLVAIVMVVFPLWQGWWRSAPIGLILFPFAWALRSRRLAAGARRRFGDFSHRSLYNTRALVVLSVAAILPPLSFFRNSKLLEDTLHIRAAQLHAALAWSSRERVIEGLEKELPLPGLDGKSARCKPEYDVYLSGYFNTVVERRHSVAETRSSNHLDAAFLRFAHFLHHSFNQIGAEALGALRNPPLSGTSTLPGIPAPAGNSPLPALPERVFQAQGDFPEWEWARNDADPKQPLEQLWVHEGADVSNTCAAADKGDSDKSPKPDLLVSSAVPRGRLSLGWNLFTFLAVALVMSLLYRLVTRRVFLFDLEEPLTQSAEELKEALKKTGNALVLTASRKDWSPELAGVETSRIDVRELAAEPDWGDKFDTMKLPGKGPVVVENFDWELAAPEFNRQRLMLIERLVAHSARLIIVSSVDPLPFLIDDHVPAVAGDAGRWAAVLGTFTRINLSHPSSWPLGDEIEKALPLLWRECNVQSELHWIAENLWQARTSRELLEPEQVIAEVGERAAEYYYLEWRCCTQEECFLLSSLARDGTVNPRNTSSLRQLLRRRLIVRDPQFRLMNESFRRFVLTHSFSMQEEWDAEAAGSGWGKARGPFATALVLVGLFLLATQQQFLQTSSGLLTAAGGGVAALLKLIGFAQGKGANS